MQNMEQGLPASAVPRNSFNLGGPANGKPGFYNWDLKDFGPRVAAAWSPRGHSGLAKSLFGEGDKTTVRAGFGMVYDRLGPALLATFDRSGSFGMSTALTNGGGVESPSTAPRIAGLTVMPTFHRQTFQAGGCTLFARPAALFRRPSPTV